MLVRLRLGLHPQVVFHAPYVKAEAAQMSFQEVCACVLAAAGARNGYELLEQFCHIISVPESVPRFIALVITTLFTPASMAAKALSSLGIIPPLMTSSWR